MHSSKPSKTPISKADLEAFLNLNSEPLEQLVTFLGFAPERLTLGFMSINFPRDREILLDLIRQDFRCQDIQLVVFYFPDPELRFLRDALLKELSDIQQEPSKKMVLMITGLEYSIGMLGEYPLVLQDLNYVRDAFTSSVPYPILVCLPNSALTRLARYAPDFWAWRMAVFQFKSSAIAVEGAVEKTLGGDYQVESLTLEDQQEMIDLLLRLLNEYPVNDQLEILSQTQTHLKILNQLGSIYYIQGDLEKAKDVFEQASQLASENKSLDETKAIALIGLGMIQKDQGNIKEAIALYKQSMIIQERIGDTLGRSTTLSHMALAIAEQGESNCALELWQQSLEISERISDFQGKNTTINNMAGVIAAQGNLDDALHLWQQSLKISERIGNAQSKATTLSSMAGVIAQQGDIDRALDFWQQSLEIQERIGDVQGKAATLSNMAGVIAQQGDIDRALDLWQQSLEILERIGDVKGKAATLSNMAGVIAQQGDIDRALDLWQQSLEIQERIGDVQGKATTLNNMARVIAGQGDIDRALELWQ